MAEIKDDPIAVDLLSIVSHYPYRRYIHYISSEEAVTDDDFQNMALSKTFWIDKSSCHKQDGSRNAAALFDLFGNFSNESAEVVRQDIIKRVELESVLYSSVAQVSLGMRKMKLSDWCTEMKDINQFPDELCVYALSRTYNHHTLILCKKRYWTTLEAALPMSKSELFEACHIHLAYLGCGMYGTLKNLVLDDDAEGTLMSIDNALIVSPQPDQCATGYHIANAAADLDDDPGENAAVTDHTYAVIKINATTGLTAISIDPSVNPSSVGDTLTIPLQEPVVSCNPDNKLVKNSPTLPVHLWLPPILQKDDGRSESVPVTRKNVKGGNDHAPLNVKGRNDSPSTEEEQEAEITKGGNIQQELSIDPESIDVIAKIEKMFVDSAKQNKCYVPLECLRPDVLKSFCPSTKSSSIDPYSSLEDVGDCSDKSDLDTENAPSNTWNKLCDKPVKLAEPENYPPVTYSHTSYFMREWRNTTRTSTRPQRTSVPTINYADLFKDDSDTDYVKEQARKKVFKPKVKLEPSLQRIAAQQLIQDRGRPKNKPHKPLLSTKKHFFRKDPVQSKPPHRKRFIKNDETLIEPKPSTSNQQQVEPGPNISHTETVSQADNIEEEKKKGTFKTTHHGIKKHKPERFFKCPSCGIHKSSVRKINEHYKRRHSPLKCVKCPMTFTTPSGLTRHLYAHSTPRYPCTDCNRSFYFSSELKVHRNIHLKIKSHFCNRGNCKRGFMNKPDLLKHVREHDAKPVNCTKCDYSTKNPRLLKSHKLVHDDVKSYKCIYCLRSFKYRTQLNRHKDSCEKKALRSDSPSY